MSSMIDTQMDPGVQVFISLRPRALKSKPCRQSNLPPDFKPSYLPTACSQQQQKQNEHKKYGALLSTKLALLVQGKTVLSISEPCCQPAASPCAGQNSIPLWKVAPENSNLATARITHCSVLPRSHFWGTSATRWVLFIPGVTTDRDTSGIDTSPVMGLQMRGDKCGISSTWHRCYLALSKTHRNINLSEGLGMHTG